MRALSDGIAGCGKSASPVWRGGRGKSMPRPYPIRRLRRTEDDARYSNPAVSGNPHIRLKLWTA